MSELNSEFDLKVSPHATQVAGTVIATGSSNANFREKGVAYGGEVISYGSTNDCDEMTGAASYGNNTGIIFSNHSYGPGAGWEGGVWYGPEFLSGEDPEFGAYTKNSKAIDAIAYFAKTSLSIWSSGNEVTDEMPYLGPLIIIPCSDR